MSPSIFQHYRSALLTLYSGNSLTVPVTFWYLFEALRDPVIHQNVSAEIKNHFDPQNQTYNFMQLTARPLLQSLHAETTRFYSGNATVRVVTTPTFALDDNYTITKGTTVFIYSNSTSFYTPGWTSTRPHLTSKSLDTFWAERFLVPGQGKREVFSDSNLAGNWTSFGGGEHKCPGRHLARNVGIATLAVLIGEYEVELVDSKGSASVVPTIKDTAFGKTVPIQKVRARIRRKRS